MSRANHILIAEDGYAVSTVLAQALHENGYEVTSARNGKEALEAVGRRKPALIIVDVEMPELDGHELCRRLKGDPSTEDIPVVLLLPLVSADHVVRGLDAGADHFLAKPCRSDELLRLLPICGAAQQRGSDLAHTHNELRRLNAVLEDRVREQTAAVTEAARQWRATFDAMNDPIFLLDEDSRIQRCNQAFREMTGKTYEDLLGRPCYEVVHGTSAPIPECPFVRLRKSHRRETMPFTANGRCFDVIVDPVRDESGRLRGAVHTLVDITERRRAEQERERLQAQLVQAQKLEAIGTLASGVAHEVNNPLMGIINYTELIKERFEGRDPFVEQSAGEILRETRRLETIVRNLL